jgi:hypothetical protein
MRERCVANRDELKTKKPHAGLLAFRTVAPENQSMLPEKPSKAVGAPF